MVCRAPATSDALLDLWPTPMDSAPEPSRPDLGKRATWIPFRSRQREILPGFSECPRRSGCTQVRRPPPDRAPPSPAFTAGRSTGSRPSAMPPPSPAGTLAPTPALASCLSHAPLRATPPSASTKPDAYRRLPPRRACPIAPRDRAERLEAQGKNSTGWRSRRHLQAGALLPGANQDQAQRRAQRSARRNGSV